MLKEHYNDALWHELFEKVCEHNPTFIALESGNEIITYGALNKKANQIAHYLLAENLVSPDGIVGVFFEKSLNLIICLLGIIKAGSAFLVLDPHAPISRSNHILKESLVLSVLTSEDFFDVLSGIVQAPVICVNHSFLSIVDKYPDSNIPRAINKLTSRNLAYVIYTSGSTGKPKGVMIEHHSLINLALEIYKLQIAPIGTFWGITAPHYFDSSIKGLSQLAYGVSLVLVDRNVLSNSNLTTNLFRKLSVIDCTPSVLESWFEMDMQSFLPDLIIGGEKISQNLWLKLKYWKIEFSKRAINVYGPAECTVDSTACEVLAEKTNIGFPIGGVKVYILDSDGDLVDKGSPGELFITGKCLARGYLNASRITAQSFVPNPFFSSTDDRSFSRMYATGDMGRYLDSGEIEYLGRSDDQVKIRGYRIELEEIERAIIQFLSIKDTVVLLGRKESKKFLIAYLIVNENFDINDLSRFVEGLLPNYMIPSRYVVIDKIPLNANGKIDKVALLSYCDLSIGVDNYNNSSIVREFIKSLWCNVLGVNEINDESDFFALDGLAQDAMKIVGSVNFEFNIDISIMNIYENSKFRDFVSLVLSATSSR